MKITKELLKQIIQEEINEVKKEEPVNEFMDKYVDKALEMLKALMKGGDAKVTPAKNGKCPPNTVETKHKSGAVLCLRPVFRAFPKGSKNPRDFMDN